jgi:putative ABC transport system permease protein
MRVTRKVPLARRMALRDRGRFLITAGGVGFAVMLMMFLSGVLEGVKTGFTRYIADCPASIWACESNASNLLRSSSFLEPEDRKELAAFPAIKEVSGLARVFMKAEIRGKQKTLLMLGVDPSSDVGLPRRMIQGTRRLGPRELILDRAFAVKNGLKPGDPLVIKDREFRIAGVSEGTNAVIIQFLFSRLSDAQELLDLGEVVSFFLLTLKDGYDPAAVLGDLKKQFPLMSFFSKEEFIENNKDELKTGVLPIFWTIAILGSIIGAAVIALMLYGSVLERRAEYALLKSIGARQQDLVFLVVRQSILASLAGCIFGLLAACLLAPLLLWLVPELTFALRADDVLLILAASFLVGLAGSWAPIQKLARIYPMEVFRG